MEIALETLFMEPRDRLIDLAKKAEPKSTPPMTNETIPKNDCSPLENLGPGKKEIIAKQECEDPQ